MVQKKKKKNLNRLELTINRRFQHDDFNESLKKIAKRMVLDFFKSEL